MKYTAIVLGAALLLCGCGANGLVKRTFNGDIYRVDRPWWDSRETFMPPEDCEDMLDLATYRFPESNDAPQQAFPEPCKRKRNYTPAGEKVDPEKLAYSKAVTNAASRDRLQEKLLALSNRECEKHHSAIVGTDGGANFGFATLASLFSGAATGFAAESTKTALAAAATFFGASRSHFNESFYRQIFVGTILEAINDDRQDALLNIYDKRRYPVPSQATDPRTRGIVIESIDTTSLTTSNAVETKTEDARAETIAGNKAAAALSEASPRLHYSIDEAIRDAEDYHDRCSFYQGLVSVASTVQQASPCTTARQRRDQIIAEISAITASDAAGAVPKTFEVKVASLKKELEKIETKVLSCIDAAQ